MGIQVGDGTEIAGACCRISQGSSSSKVSEFIAEDAYVGFDFVEGSVKAEGGAVEKEGAKSQEEGCMRGFRKTVWLMDDTAEEVE
jgi:hypothetical protein